MCLCPLFWPASRRPLCACPSCKMLQCFLCFLRASRPRPARPTRLCLCPAQCILRRESSPSVLPCLGAAPCTGVPPAGATPRAAQPRRERLSPADAAPSPTTGAACRQTSLGAGTGRRRPCRVCGWQTMTKRTSVSCCGLLGARCWGCGRLNEPCLARHGGARRRRGRRRKPGARLAREAERAHVAPLPLQAGWMAWSRASATAGGTA